MPEPVVPQPDTLADRLEQIAESPLIINAAVLRTAAVRLRKQHAEIQQYRRKLAFIRGLVEDEGDALEDTDDRT